VQPWPRPPDIVSITIPRPGKERRFCSASQSRRGMALAPPSGGAERNTLLMKQCWLPIGSKASEDHFFATVTAARSGLHCAAARHMKTIVPLLVVSLLVAIASASQMFFFRWIGRSILLSVYGPTVLWFMLLITAVVVYGRRGLWLLVGAPIALLPPVVLSMYISGHQVPYVSPP
jgi:hypothetical protein